MGQGQDVKTRDEPKIEIQEKGEIYFFYRPKVEKEEAHSSDDVQRMYVVLRPESGENPVEEKQDPSSGKEGAAGGSGAEEVNIEKQMLLRLMVLGKKTLPDPTQKSRPHWGYVEMVTTNAEDVTDALKGEEYDTSTRGHRHKSPSRALGEGVYRILRHINPAGKGKSKKTHTHLIYKLKFPTEDAHKNIETSSPQESLNIEHEASFIIQIKNPEVQQGSGNFRGLQKKRKATFPAHLQGQLGKLRFCPADPPDFLNYEGCEFLLIAASDDIDEELGLELQTRDHDDNDDDDSESCSDLLRTFGESGATTSFSTTPLFEGTWA